MLEKNNHACQYDSLVSWNFSQALYYTGNQSAEAAASYVFDNPDIDVMPPLVKTRRSRRKQKKDKNERQDSEESDEAEPMLNYKMVFVVNTALGMGVGKIASQVAHACLGIYKLVNEFQYMSEVIGDWEDEGWDVR